MYSSDLHKEEFPQLYPNKQDTGWYNIPYPLFYQSMWGGVGWAGLGLGGLG